MASQRKSFVRGVAGKVIKQIETGVEEDQVYVDIHFQDGTSCVIYIGPPQVRVESAQVLGWRTGDSYVIRNLL